MNTWIQRKEHSAVDRDAKLVKNGESESSLHLQCLLPQRYHHSYRFRDQGDHENGRKDSDAVVADSEGAGEIRKDGSEENECLTSITPAFLMRTCRISGKDNGEIGIKKLGRKGSLKLNQDTEGLLSICSKNF